MTPNLKVGDWAPPKEGDVRSPCPAINALANHGYLPRDGRDVQVTSFLNGLDKLGLGKFLAYIFAYPIYIERAKPGAPKTTVSWGQMLAHPFNYALANFAIRNAGQTDSKGNAVLNIDQLGLHNVIEHDVSLSRYDFAQGDNHSAAPDLVNDLIHCSSNGTTITFDDLVELRKRRIAKQKEINPQLDWSQRPVILASAETALILKVLGNGQEVPVSYVKAFFQDGRIPREEGWKKSTWAVGFIAMNMLAQKVQKALGYDAKGAAIVVPLAPAVTEPAK